MNAHKITVTQTTPSGDSTSFTLDVLAASVDLALERVYGWYNREHEMFEKGDHAALSLAPPLLDLHCKGDPE